MNLGERLLEYRKKIGLSQEEVASKLNVTRQTISKWETEQSVPDFDKIVPICELFKITTEELLTGSKLNYQEVVQIDQNRKAKAVAVSISVFLYFISIIWIIIAEEVISLNEGLTISIFMFICAIATINLIYFFTINGFTKKKIEKKRNKNLRAAVDITSLLFTIIYFYISFITQAWHITWIIWLVYSIAVVIIKLIFNDKGEENE